MNGDRRCLKEEEFRELKNRISELEKDVQKSSYMIDSVNLKIDELKEMVKSMIEEISKVHDYRYKVSNLDSKYVSRQEFHELQIEVSKIKERFIEGDRVVQRYQWYIALVLGIISLASILKPLL